MYEEKTLQCIECDKIFKKILLGSTETQGFLCPSCSADDLDPDE